MNATVSSKGQIVIPSKLRKKYGIHKGSRILVLDRNDHIELKPISPAYLKSLKGSLKGSAALDSLLEERRKDRELDS